MCHARNSIGRVFEAGKQLVLTGEKSGKARPGHHGESESLHHRLDFLPWMSASPFLFAFLHLVDEDLSHLSEGRFHHLAISPALFFQPFVTHLSKPRTISFAIEGLLNTAKFAWAGHRSVLPPEHSLNVNSGNFCAGVKAAVLRILV